MDMSCLPFFFFFAAVIINEVIRIPVYPLVFNAIINLGFIQGELLAQSIHFGFVEHINVDYQISHQYDLVFFICFLQIIHEVLFSHILRLSQSFKS